MVVLHKKRRKRVSFSGVHFLLLFTAPANFWLKQPSPSFPTCSNVLEYRKGIDLGRFVTCSNASAKIGAVSADPVQITLETGPIFSGFMDTPEHSNEINKAASSCSPSRQARLGLASFKLYCTVLSSNDMNPSLLTLLTPSLQLAS